MRTEVARLPEFVVSVVLHQVVPEFDLAFEIKFVGVRQRAEFQIKLVTVGRFVIERLWLLARRLVEFLAEPGKEPERVRQIERAVVMEIVADEPIGNRRLRRGALERGVRVDHARRRVKARIGNAHHADFAVVVRHLLHQPIDRVVGIGALINVPRPGLHLLVWTHVDKFAFRTVAPAHVLQHEDELLLRVMLERPSGIEVTVFTVGFQTVRRARQQDRPRLRFVLRRIDGSEKPHAVAHRDFVFEFGVVLAEVGFGDFLGLGFCLIGLSAGAGRAEGQQ